MATNLNKKRSMFLSATVAVSAMVGCQAAPLTKPAVETTATAHITPSAAQPQQPSQDPGTNPIAADPNKDVPTNDGALDAATAMHISAKDGGVYKSDDGLLTAIFPPGALSQDADVKLVRVDTSNLKNSDVFLNGIRYQWDLGDAHVMPGTKITVTSKADDRLVPALKNMYTDFTMERYSLSKDDKGNYNVTMSYSGAVPSQDTKDPNFKAPTRGTMQEGAVPLGVPGSAIFKQESRVEAFCNYAPPPLPAPTTLFCAHVTWTSDDYSGLANKPAHGDGASQVWVRFGTDFVNAPLPPEYKITKTEPATPDRSEVDTDAYGNIKGSIPADYRDIVNAANDKKARGTDPMTGDAFAGYLNATDDGPGSPTIWNSSQLFNGYPVPSSNASNATIKLLDAKAGTPAKETVDETNVQLPANANGWYVTGGKADSGSCNCGAYVYSNNRAIIENTDVTTDSNGDAKTTTLMSYNSYHEVHGVGAGGWVYFTIYGQAHTDYPDKASNSDEMITSSLYGKENHQDSAAAGCMPLETPKYTPFVNLHLTDSNKVPYSGTLLMDYTIIDPSGNKTAHKMSWGLDDNKTGAELDLGFFVGNQESAPVITDDGDWTFQIDKIYTADLQVVGGQADLRDHGSFKIRRNNSYTYKYDLVLNEAK
jgi:hypothetical protein